MVSRRTYRWSSIWLLASLRPGTWITHADLQNAPARTVQRIRDRGHPALHNEHAHLEARITNRYTDELGTERGDIWVRRVPNGRVISPTEGQTKGRNHGHREAEDE